MTLRKVEPARVTSCIWPCSGGEETETGGHATQQQQRGLVGN